MPMKKERFRIDSRINMLVVSTTAFALMILGIGFIVFFLLFNSGNNERNMEYVLTGTTRQVQDNVQFIEDGIKSIRHSSVLQKYLRSPGAEQEIAQEELIKSFDLFSERNRSAGMSPFVTDVYLFAETGEYIKISYYPETASMQELNDKRFQGLVDTFLVGKDGYMLFSQETGTEQVLISKIYNDDMNSIGVCAVAINLDKIKEIFAPIEKYDLSVWKFGFRNPSRKAETELLSHGNSLLGRKGMEQDASYAFGFYSHTMIDNSNIYYGFGGIGISLFVFSVLILAGIAVVVFRLNKAVYEKELLSVKTEVKYLQSQLNPHFQYNILAMLSIKALASGDDALYQSLMAFSALVRGKIFKDKEVYILLEDEMELIQFYLQLQEERFGEDLTYQILYDKEALGKLKIPKLIIEPLVENAVEHGIEPKDGPGNVRVEAKLEENELILIVEDDGIGLGTGKTSEHTGTSLMNTKQLLKVLYPRKHQVDVQTEEGIGTKIQIRIPAKYD